MSHYFPTPVLGSQSQESILKTTDLPSAYPMSVEESGGVFLRPSAAGRIPDSGVSLGHSVVSRASERTSPEVLVQRSLTADDVEHHVDLD